MPVSLYVNQNRFMTVRHHATVIDNDTLPIPMSLANDQRFDAQGARNIVFYWSKVGGVLADMDITVYYLDGDEGKFLIGDKVSSLPPDTPAELQCLFSSNAVLAISGIGAPVSASYKIRAMGIT